MRHINKMMSTSCLFFCLGGLVYNGQAIRAEEVLNAAAAAAATPGAAAPAGEPQMAQAIDPGNATPPAGTVPVVSGNATPPATPATTSPGTNVNLGTSVLNVGVDGKVEQINFHDMDITTALQFLSLQTKTNIIASKDVKGTVTVNLYDVTFTQALDSLLKPNGFDYIARDKFIYVYTAKELDEIRKRDRKTVNRIYHLKYMNAGDANTLIKPMISSTGIVALSAPSISGLPSGTTDTGGNQATEDTLVINDYPENLDEITQALKQLDVRPKQVLIEATVLNASLNDSNALGIDLVSLSGLNFSDIGSVISPLTGTATTGGSGGSTTSSNVTTPGQLTGTLIPGVANNQATAGTNFAKDVQPGGLSVGFLSNHISVFLRALETVTDTTVVANPKILALNRQHGEVHIGAKLGYLTTTTSQTTTNQTVQFLDVGTKLVFRPFIAEDGYIRMEIHPEDSSGAIDSRGIPQTTTTEVTSNVMIRDGRTIVIGGLFRELTTGGRSQVPVLGNIPILGTAFRSTNDNTQRSETIVLMTPHIINDDTSLWEESKKESEDVTRFMMGNRAGLQPWGRDRMAHMWYSKAQEELEKGDKEKALMFTEWAINTNPRFIEALRLREQLTNRKMDEAVGSSVINLVRHTLEGDATTTPDAGGPTVVPTEVPTTVPADKR